MQHRKTIQRLLFAEGSSFNGCHRGSESLDVLKDLLLRVSGSEGRYLRDAAAGSHTDQKHFQDFGSTQ